MIHKPQNNHYELFADFPVLKTVKVSVVIPVKNEEAYILECLSCFLAQTDSVGEKTDFRSFEVLILANNCTDGTVNLIKNFQQKNPDLQLHLEEIKLENEKANIGYVRKKLMDTAFFRLEKNGGGLILTTDGDTSVSNDWIHQTINEMENGADAVGGRILLKTEELLILDDFTSTFHFMDDQYHLLISELEAKIIEESHDCEPRHHQHFNGSFAITSHFYGKSGGVPEVENMEDLAFFEQLQKMDAKVRHSKKVVVHTSARYIGRTEIGLSYQLNKWKNLGLNNEDFLVESCESISKRLFLKKKLKDLWAEREIDRAKCQKILRDMQLSSPLSDAFFETEYFGQFYHEFCKNIRLYEKENNSLISINQAVTELQQLVANHFKPDFSQTSIL